MPRFLKRILSPFLRVLTRWYLSKPRLYSTEGVKIEVLPGVFHPGLFFSTAVLIQYMKSQSIRGSRILELGAGTGLLSIFCATQGAVVTASDISDTAVRNIGQNAARTGADVRVVKSDLFVSVVPDEFDWILINPPFYPRVPANESELAWFCGADFGYFRNLFSQLHEKQKTNVRVIMVLSEDCDRQAIDSIAATNSYRSTIVHESQNGWERLVVLQWSPSA